MSISGRGLYLGVDDALDDWDEDGDERCTVCGGDIWVECGDPIQCTYRGCDGEFHPDPCCQGTGSSRHQVIW